MIHLITSWTSWHARRSIGRRVKPLDSPVLVGDGHADDLRRGGSPRQHHGSPDSGDDRPSTPAAGADTRAVPTDCGVADIQALLDSGAAIQIDRAAGQCTFAYDHLRRGSFEIVDEDRRQTEHEGVLTMCEAETAHIPAQRPSMEVDKVRDGTEQRVFTNLARPIRLIARDLDGHCQVSSVQRSEVGDPSVDRQRDRGKV